MLISNEIKLEFKYQYYGDFNVLGKIELIRNKKHRLTKHFMLNIYFKTRETKLNYKTILTYY